MKQVKVTVVGDCSVGKTSLINALFRRPIDNIESTIGASFMTFLSPNYNIKLNIWDCAGQARFRSMIPMYMRNANVIIYCFPIDLPFDRECAEEIMTDVFRIVSKVDIFMIGTKLDRIPVEERANSGTSKPEVSTLNYKKQDAEKFAEDFGARKVFYTSAKKNIGVEECFGDIIEMIKDNQYETETIFGSMVRLNEKKSNDCCSLV